MTVHDGDLAALREILESVTLPAQRKAVVAQDPLVVVGAGAGTGKTWTLAWRFVWAVITGRARVQEILTLTFTEKAATEMQGRIRSLMESLLGMTELPRSIVPLLKDGLEHLDEGYISTIHAFASRVIGESGLSLDMDPASRVASSPEEDIFWERMTDVLDRLDFFWIGQMLAGDERAWALDLMNRPTVADLLGGYSPKAVTEFARGLMGLCSSRGEGPHDLVEWAENLDERHEAITAAVLSTAIQGWRELHELWLGSGGILSGLTLDGTQFAGRLALLQDRWSGDLAEDQYVSCIQELREAIKGARGKLADVVGCLLPEGTVKAHRERLLKQAFLERLATDGWSPVEMESTGLLLGLTALCWFCWERRKADRNLMAFDDMILRAGEALAANRDYVRRFKEVLVDEFQDTNGLQDRLIRSITSDGQAKVFLVGDLKQSIYRFRHADLSLFGRYIERAKNGEGRYISLDVSFRMADGLLEEINRLFGSIWRRGLGASLPHGYEPLRAPKEQTWYGERQNVTVPAWESVLYVPSQEEGTTAEEKRLRAASLLAARLSAMVGLLTVWDKARGEIRPVQWGDIAVLVRSRTTFPSIQKVLGEFWGIPLHMEKNTGYYARTEVRDCVALLRSLADPGDHLALAGFLCSPFSGIPLPQALGLLEDSRNSDLPDLLARRYPDVACSLERWRRTGRILGASRVMEGLISQAPLLEGIAEWKRSGVAANLRRTVDMLREYEASMGGTLSGASSWLGDALRRRAKGDEAEAVSDDNVVRVMTVHAAKGLEFPVVVLAGCDSVSRNRGRTVQPSAYLGAALSRDMRGEETLGRQVHGFLEERAEMEEAQRLFYVACTRARDCLILNGVDDPVEGSWLSMVEELNRPPAAEIPGGVGPCRDRPSLPDQGPIVGMPVAARGLDRISATSWSLYRYCPYGWRLRFRQGIELVWEQPDGDGDGGPDMGSLAHWLLARWDFSDDGLERLMALNRSALPSELQPLWGDGASRNVVRDWLRALTTSREGQELRPLWESRSLKREVPFRVSLPGGPLLVGAVDVMWLTDGGWVVRDYKSTAEGGAPEGLYEDQLRFYGLAVWLASGRNVASMALWHLRNKCRLDVVTLGPYRSWDHLSETVTVDALAAASGPWEPRLDRCDRCPFAGQCDRGRR